MASLTATTASRRIIGVLHRLSDAALFQHSFVGVFHPELWQAPMSFLSIYSLSDCQEGVSILCVSGLSARQVVWEKFNVIIPIKSTKAYG